MKRNRKLYGLLALTAFTLTACDGSYGWGGMWPSKSLDTTLSKVFSKAVKNGFSGVVLVRYRGTILLHEAAGMANEEINTANTIHTVFDIGSITKQFTAALIMALQEEGLLTINDSLADHFEDVPKDKADITIHQLLTHSAGFRRGFGGDTIAIDRETFLSLALATRLDYKPGTKYQYSNAGYSIAAAVAEIVSDQAYEAALRKFILMPAKLDDTGYVMPDWSNHPIAVGYKKQSELGITSAWWDTDIPYWNLVGNGGLRTTSGDLLKWHDELSQERVLNKSSVETLQARHIDVGFGTGDADRKGHRFYGYGWVTEDIPSVGTVHRHSGSNGFFKAIFGRAIDENLVVIVLSNESNGAPELLVDNIGRAVIRSM